MMEGNKKEIIKKINKRERENNKKNK